MGGSPLPTGVSTRELLARALPDVSDFDAFCHDHFPDVFRRFTHGMDQVARGTQLLRHTDPGDLHARLTTR